MWHPTLCKLDFMKRKFVIILNITLLITVLSFLKVKTWRNIPEATFLCTKLIFCMLYTVSVCSERCVKALPTTRFFRTSTRPELPALNTCPCGWKSIPSLSERISGVETVGRRRAFVQLMRHVPGGQALGEYVTSSSAQLEQTGPVKLHEHSVLLSKPAINHWPSWTSALLDSYLCADETSRLWGTRCWLFKHLRRMISNCTVCVWSGSEVGDT